MCRMVQKRFLQILGSIGRKPDFLRIYDFFQGEKFFISQTMAPTPLYTAHTYDKHFSQVTASLHRFEREETVRFLTVNIN